MPESASRRVSFHDVDAGPIRKGRLGRPVEFGYKAQVVDNVDGVILDHNVEVRKSRRRPPTGPGHRTDLRPHRAARLARSGQLTLQQQHHIIDRPCRSSSPKATQQFSRTPNSTSPSNAETGPQDRRAPTLGCTRRGTREPDDWRRWVPEAAQRYLPRPDEDWTQFVPPEWRTWLDASPAPRPQTPTLRFIAVDEERPGPRWSALYGETREAYRDWWLGGKGSRPDRATAEASFNGMPELVDAHAELVRLAGDDDTVAALLTLWNPPPFIVACSQAVVPDRDTGKPVLLRNYDYDPRLVRGDRLPVALERAARDGHRRLPVGAGAASTTPASPCR